MDNRLLDKIKMKPEKEDELKSIIRRELDQAITNFNKLREEWRKWEKAYEMKLIEERETPWEGSANLDIGLVPALVDHLQKELLDLVFGFSPLFFVYPAALDYPAEVSQSAQRWQNYLDILLTYRLRVRKTLSQWIHYALKYGTGWLKIVWNIEREYKRREIIVKEEEQYATLEEEYEEVGQPLIIALSPKDVIPLPANACSLDSVWGIAHKESLRLHEIMARVRNGKYLPERVEELKEWHGKQEQEKLDEVGATSSEEVFIRRWDIYEIICRYDIDGDDEGELIVVDYARDPDLILSIAPYPYDYVTTPYIPLQLIPREKSLQGISFIGRIYYLCEAINTLNNQRLDIFSLMIKPPIQRSVTSNWDEQETPIAPGIVIDVVNPGEIQYFMPPNITVPSAEIEQMLQGYLTRLTGLAETRLGVTTRRMTATEVSALMGAIPRQMSHFLFEAMVEIPQKIQALFRQFMKEESSIAGIEPMSAEVYRTAKLQLEDVKYNYIYAVHGSALVPDSEKMVEMYLLTYREMLQNPLVNQDPQKIYALSRMLLTALRVRNYREILGDEPPSREEMEQEAQAQQQAQGQQAQGLPSPEQMQMLQQAMQGGMPQTAGTPPTEEEPGIEEETSF